MLGWGRASDRLNERRWHLLIACVFAAGGLILAGMTMGTWWALAGMSIAAMGFYGSKGPFFAMPPMFLSGTGLAAGIAWINSLGNLGGFFGPWYVGVMKDLTGSFSGGLYGLALTGLISAFVCAFFLHIPNRTLSAAMRTVEIVHRRRSSASSLKSGMRTDADGPDANHSSESAPEMTCWRATL